MEKEMFEDFDLSGFWNDTEFALKEYVSESPADELVSEIEEELGYKLPKSYIWLMKQHNGGIPVNTCFPTNKPTSWAQDHVAVKGIMGIGRDKDRSICGFFGSQFWIDEWEYPPIGVAVCDCPSGGHDMIFLDYSECGADGEPKIVHVDQDCDFEITFLAENFESFICGLVNEQVYDNSEKEKQECLEMIKNAPFSELLAELCKGADQPPETERWIRGISHEIIQNKGHYSLHADEQSYLIYDIQFWLYTKTYPETTKADYLKEYEKMIALAGKGNFSSGGYGPSFVKEWLTERIKQGEIISRNGYLAMTEAAKARLLEKRKEFEDKS